MTAGAKQSPPPPARGRCDSHERELRAYRATCGCRRSLREDGGGHYICATCDAPYIGPRAELPPSRRDDTEPSEYVDALFAVGGSRGR
jgi:hypothetical protein